MSKVKSTVSTGLAGYRVCIVSVGCTTTCSHCPTSTLPTAIGRGIKTGVSQNHCCPLCAQTETFDVEGAPRYAVRTMSGATCFNGHDLGPRLHKSLSWYCSMCGKGSESRVSPNSCVRCGFDACSGCIGNGATGNGATGNSPTGCSMCPLGHPLSQPVCTAEQGCSECSRPVPMTCCLCGYSVCDGCSITQGIDGIDIDCGYDRGTETLSR
jgi:hypothetical protein